MPSPEYYHRQADLCLRMALLASEYEERVRLLDIANGYRDNAARVEALQERDLNWVHPQRGPSDGCTLPLTETLAKVL
jgi:hypothetical protein